MEPEKKKVEDDDDDDGDEEEEGEEEEPEKADGDSKKGGTREVTPNFSGFLMVMKCLQSRKIEIQMTTIWFWECEFTLREGQ